MTTTNPTQDAMPTPTDFDNWTEADEADALAAAAATYQVKHIIKGDKYLALAWGKVFTLPLSLGINDFDAISNADTDTESIAAIRRVLRAFAGDDQAKALGDVPIQVVMNLLSDYGEVITNTQGVGLGK